MQLVETGIQKARAEAYQLFSALFCEPEQELFRDQLIFNRLQETLRTIYPEIAPQIDDLAEQCQRYSTQELLVDYTKLFLGPFEVIAQPYSAVYWGDNQLMNDITAWVDDFYRSSGLPFDYGIHDLPDHIVVELEFMFQLANKEWQAQEDGNEQEVKRHHGLQKEFLTGHLAIWATKMADIIQKSSLNAYYSTLAACLKDFLNHEKAFFKNPTT